MNSYLVWLISFLAALLAVGGAALKKSSLYSIVPGSLSTVCISSILCNLQF